MKILLLCWRDTHHPEGGGSERYLERVADHLAAQGHQVIFRTARYAGSARRESVQTQQGQGTTIEFSRGGGAYTVYLRALAGLAAARLGLPVGPLQSMGRPDVVVDTQNGVPFFASLVAGAPTVILTHHCHREQWSVAGPLLARIGWFIESTVSPWLHRKNRWVTVSSPSAEELVGLGVPKEKIDIIRNGIDPAAELNAPAPREAQDDEHTIHLVTLSRLVPHKQIEHALDAVAALIPQHPNLRLDVIGDGWWKEKLHAHARELGVEPYVVFHGHVTEDIKHRILSRAAIHVMPSRKEGWGLAVVEAGQRGVPTVGYYSSAGLRDSVDDNVTGLLAGSPGGFINAVEELVQDPEKTSQMGEAARKKAEGYSWQTTGEAWGKLLEDVASSGR